MENNQNEKFEKVSRHIKNNREAARNNYKSQSKRRLQKIIETKINTTMIGAISAVEQRLGHLWGQGKPREQLTDRELIMLAVKDDLRTDILNNGNNQKRAAIAEIHQYDVEWNRYHVDMGVNTNWNGPETNFNFQNEQRTEDK